jgi:hypothetical protein
MFANPDTAQCFVFFGNIGHNKMQDVILSLPVIQLCGFVGLAYQGNNIVFRFIIEYIVAQGILAPPR